MLKKLVKILSIVFVIIVYYVVVFYKNNTKNNNQAIIESNDLNICSVYLVNFPEYKYESVVEDKEIFEEKIQEEQIQIEPNIYDSFSELELKLLYRVVEAEVTGTGYFNEKCNVVSVIFNRINAQWGSIEDILIPTQFACLADGRAYQVEITEETIKACEYVYAHGDTTNGSLFFDSTHGNSWASHNCVYIFTDKVGHDFYKLNS